MNHLRSSRIALTSATFGVFGCWAGEIVTAVGPRVALADRPWSDTHSQRDVVPLIGVEEDHLEAWS